MNDATHFAAVRCRGDNVPGQLACGLVYLTFEQYEREMMRPNVGWSCPQCGSSADYDDAVSEQLQGIDDDDEEVPR